MIPGAGDLMMFGGAAVGDPYFANVSLLMHMDGANDGTVFTDVKGKTVTRAGNTVTKTTTKQFGTASAYFDGVGDYLNVANSTDFTLSNDFTIEAWVHFTGGLGTNITFYDDETPAEYGTLFQKNSADKISFGYVPSNASSKALSENIVFLVGTTTITTGTWYHVAACRSGSTFRLFVNGIAEVNTAMSIGIYNPGGVKYIGQRYNDTQNITGYIDDLRITKGVARYTANFTPPTAAFPDF